MSAYARFTDSTAPSYSHIAEASDAHDWLPGERIGAPPRRSRLKRAAIWLTLLALGGAGWTYREDPLLREAVTTGTSIARQAWASVEARTRPQAQQSATNQAPPVESTQPGSTPRDATPVMKSASLPDAPVPAAPVEVATVTPAETAAVPPTAKTYEETPPPARPPAGAGLDGKATAAGLHPDLSKILLKKLSDIDFRNAGIAIEKALATASDKDVLIWPEKEKAGLARFRIHFVEGAAEGCRRYVVTISKDGWLTTALPMERCGTQTAQAARG